MIDDLINFVQCDLLNYCLCDNTHKRDVMDKFGLFTTESSDPLVSKVRNI